MRPWLVLLTVACGCSERALPIDTASDVATTATRYYDLDTAAAACLTVSRCGVTVRPTKLDLNTCIVVLTRVDPASLDTGLDSDEVHCLAAARGDCSLASACASGEPCKNDQRQFPFCDGSVLRTCEGGALRSRDCAASGLACIAGSCSTVACFSSKPQTAAVCHGALITGCTGTSGSDCGDVGARCVDDALGPVCIGDGPACARYPSSGVPSLPGVRCERDTLVSCVHGQEARFDCTSVGERCWALSSGGAQCGLAAECDPTTYQPSCPGGAITFCEAGKIVTLSPWHC